MTPKELLEKAIRYNDMDLVKEAYDVLYNREYDLSDVETTNPESVRRADEIIAKKSLAQKLIAPEDDKDPVLQQIEERRNHGEAIRGKKRDASLTAEDFKMQEGERKNTKKVRRVPLDTKKIGAFNIFKDDGSLAEDDKTKWKKAPRKIAPREQVEYVTAECVTCHGTFNVHPTHAPIVDLETRERSYRCEECSSKLKRKNR